MVRTTMKLLGLLLLAALAVSPARAEMVLYTFDSPQFVVGQRTPFLDRAPNVGLADFRTSFISSPFSPGFLVDLFSPNVLFRGQMMYDPGPLLTPNTLTLNFNMPVDRVQLDFAVVEPGRLLLTSPVGSLSLDSRVVGGSFEGGTLVFSSDTPFTTLQLQAFTRANAPTLFALDNLSANTSAVPEPASVVLFVVGLGSCGGILFARRRRGSLPDETEPTS